eukprot:CAMPEP_0170625074 /NCGR_PEP_ID=MMETSP0224-20130122/30569_1 /TAXON_ID=285029 /ORGANISM="Togula jolla, Strain CCCM 725" /LENGTH=232 /DNA_ID=CAMNT_0010951633 /DNA_START=297 /DNA_END=995 /DNA_ORIENTATION=+
MAGLSCEVAIYAPLHREVRNHKHRLSLAFELYDDRLETANHIPVRLSARAWIPEVQLVALSLLIDLWVLLLHLLVTHTVAVATIKLVQQGRAHHCAISYGANCCLQRCRSGTSIAPLSHEEIASGLVNRRCAHQHHHVGTLNVPRLTHIRSGFVQVLCQIVDELLAAGGDLVGPTPNPAIAAVLSLGVAYEPDSPRIDVDVAEVEADVAHNVPRAPAHHYLTAHVEDFHVDD